MRKSQTATEYLIILAVVIVIALVVVNTMGGFPGIGAGSGKKVSDLKLASDTVGIESYSIGTDSSLFKLKNNYYDTITVTEFRVNQDDNLTCNSSNTVPSLPIVLNIGQSMIITCSVVNTSTYTLSSKQTPMVGVTYTDNMGASRTAGNEGSAVATSGSQGEVTPPETPPETPSHTITFNSNGGTGSMSAQTIQENASANLTANNFTRTNYTFNGWNTLANGSGSNYSDNVSYTMGSGNVTLYAKWTAVVAGCGDPTNPDCWSPAVSDKTWGPTGVTTGAQNDTDGAANTIHLMTHSTGDYPAADYCDTLDYGGHTDWYLPAKQQLIDGLTNQFVTPGGTVTGFAESTSYWSSTENSGYPEDYVWYALYDSFDGVYSDNGVSKDYTNHQTRCLR